MPQRVAQDRLEETKVQHQQLLDDVRQTLHRGEELLEESKILMKYIDHVCCKPEG